MSNKILLLAAGMLAFTVMSCKETKKDTNIITHKKVVTAPKKTQKVGDYSQSRDVEWLGSEYAVAVDRKADSSLPLVDDGAGNKYYDNRISVKVTRKDGTTFFSRTFTKSDFSQYVDEPYRNGALLGIVLDKAEGDCLYFAASVGSPDTMSDEYVPLVMRIGRTGQVSISKDTQLDTGSDAASSELEKAEEEGV